MSRRDLQSEPVDTLLEEAADWVVRLVSGEANQADADNLAKWRAESPAHEAAFREVAGVGNYVEVARTTRPPMDRRAFLAGGTVAVAALSALGLARPPMGLWPSFAELMADHRTPVGGQYAFSPREGVKVEMSSRTSVSLGADGRAITLIGGETFVTADNQDRPFRVAAPDLAIAVTRAEFNVQALEHLTRVTCVKGTLECQVRGKGFLLGQDESLTLAASGTAQRSRIDAVQTLAWRRGLLVFEGSPLLEVVDQINLYRSGRVILATDAIASLPVNAVFHTNQIANAVSQLEMLLHLKARHMAAGVVLLG